MACSCGCSKTMSPRPWRPIAMRVARVVQLPTAPVGELRGVIYRTSRVPGEEPKNYVHFFEDKLPILTTNPAGTRLYIVGGSYRVKNNGIHG
jgi:hypothetical protein